VLHEVIAEKKDVHEVVVRRNRRPMTIRVAIPEE
jgi:hypothetical protein